MVQTQERVHQAQVEATRKRFGLLHLLLAFVVGCVIGWGMDEVNDDGKDHILPGGRPTDGVSGPSPSDRVGK